MFLEILLYTFSGGRYIDEVNEPNIKETWSNDVLIRIVLERRTRHFIQYDRIFFFFLLWTLSVYYVLV